MKIEYFECGKSGTISRGEIDTDDSRYLGHTEDDVTLIFWGESTSTLSLTRHFNNLRDKLIANHKQTVEKLQKEISELESSDTFEEYQKRN